MTVAILHLSDIHIKTKSDPILCRTKEIAAATYSSLPDAHQLFILVSGDIAYSGQQDQFELAGTFLRGIETAVRLERDVPTLFVFAPGNHDCNFDLDTRMRQIAIQHLAEATAPTVDDSVIDHCTAVQAPYFAFLSSFDDADSIRGDKLWRTYQYEVSGKLIAFDCLNVSWVSRKNEEQGALYFPFERYQTKELDGAEIRILVMHHPLNWFGKATYRPFRAFIRKLANVIVTGHEHQGNVGENLDSESEHSAYVEGCVLQGEKDLTDSSFNLIVLDVDKGQYKSTRYGWKRDHYEPSAEGSWSDYRELPAKKRSLFDVDRDFRAVLDDPGGYFRRANAPVALADIYVFPDMADAGAGPTKQDIVSSSLLRDPERTRDGVLVQGQERVGCSSLLARLYDEYHNRGYVPLYIQGRDLRNATDREVDGVIRRALREQYGADTTTRFEQLSREKKLLLLDDFDDCPIRSPSMRAVTLSKLRQRFAHAVVTVGDLFEIREVVEQAEGSELRSFAHFRLLPFNYALRTKLIQRWFRIGADASLDESAFITKWDDAEKLIESVLQRNVIPSLPFFLLTLLQGIDAERSGDFKESAPGFYYQYLITEGIREADIPVAKWSEYIEFSAGLAWYFHTKGASELSEDDVRRFNDLFSTQFHPGDYETRVQKLIRAKILTKRGGYLLFQYPYIYYFLKGRYLSQRLQDSEIRSYVTRCCKHLYVRENANTIIFLAHHTPDDFVVNAILSTLRGLFSHIAPLTFAGDTSSVAALINNAPELQYSGGKPEEHRNKLSAMKDEIDDGSDGLAEREEDGSTLSLFAMLTTLGKTVDILGQIIKNQYARIERPRKVELISELFSGPLRALRSFYTFLEKTPDYLVGEIETALEKRSDIDEEARKRVARQIVAAVIQSISASFVKKAGGSVSGDVLSADVRTAVQQNGSLAFRLIESGLVLDSNAALPRQYLKELSAATESDPVAVRILNLQVLWHLYMFRTSEQDKQWLASKDGLRLNLRFQHALDAKGMKQKKFKDE
jgi:hypothetical protein